MKKILTIVAVAVSGIVAYGQGTVEIFNFGSTYANYTNTAISSYAGGTQTGGTSGETATAANGFYFALLTSTYGGAAPSANPIDAAWTLALVNGTSTPIVGTNLAAAGGITANGGGLGVAVSGWAAGATEYIQLVGWSANLGTSWAQVSSELTSGWNGINTSGHFFGTSGVAYIASGGVGSPASPATLIFGGTGLPSGITMYQVQAAPVPEPTTLALAGLGGLSMLLFRRKKA